MGLEAADKGRPTELLVPQPGILTIFAGPTASGKSSVVNGLLERYPRMRRVVTTTTREPRQGEIPGDDYHFLSPEVFQAKLVKGDFLESEQYGGKKFYGTQTRDIEPLFAGQDLLWIVNMGRTVDIEDYYRKAFSSEKAAILIDRTLLILIGIESVEKARERFVARGGEGSFRARIRQDAKVWKTSADKFPHVLINRDGELDQTIDEAARIIENKRRLLIPSAK